MSSTSSPKGEVVDFSGDVFPAVARTRGSPLHGHVADGYWEDVGTIESYLQAHADVLDGRVQVDIGGFQVARAACGSGRAPTSTPTPASTGRL